MRSTGSILLFVLAALSSMEAEELLTWTPLPPIPSELGVAGPFTGVHQDQLIVAGGANFPQPVWENDKVWHDEIFALPLQDSEATWQPAGKLPRPLGYGTTVSVPEGIICIGGNDAESIYADVFLLRWEGGSIAIDSLPGLPNPLCYASAARLGNYIYLAGGQTGPGLETATGTFLRLDWSKQDDPESFQWETLSTWPGPPRAFASLVAQNNGTSDCLYLVGGRFLNEASETIFLYDLYQFTSDTWTRKCDLPAPLAAGTVGALGKNYLVTLGGADGSLFQQSDALRDNHPGFPKTIFAYDCRDDSWIEIGEMPMNQVTTEVVPWQDGFLLASGEVRPRVRTPDVWRIAATDVQRSLSSSERWLLWLLPIVGITLTILLAYRSRKWPRARP